MLPFFRRTEERQIRGWADWLYPAGLGLLFVAAWYIFRVARVDAADTWLVLLPDVIFFFTAFLFRQRMFRFALGFAILLMGYTLTIAPIVENGERIHVSRNFFGVKKVLFDVDQNVRKLLHGDTLHGLESADGLKSGKPLAYYHPSGPVGDVIAVLGDRPDQRVAVIGLGTGTMAAYASPYRQMTFVDVDSQMETIARGFFSFVRRCGDDCTIVISDGRLALENAPDGYYDLVMLDAFSSDSIPAHLVSREALKIYQSKLKEDGLLLFHVSNRYLRVEKLVCAVVNDAGLAGYFISDRDETIIGKSGSDYVVAVNPGTYLGEIETLGTWAPVPKTCDVPPWTDDYSNMLSLVRWRRQ
jgi:SAM-dependent methyltransferase